MSYNAWSVTAFEQPTTAKWNILGANDASLRDGSGILWNNNQQISVKNAAGTTKQFAKVDASDDLQIGENDQLGHTVVNAGSSKLVKIKILRQSDTTNAYLEKVVFLDGYGIIAGNGSSKRILEALTFGITFASAPRPSVSCAANTATATPASISDITSFGNNTAATVSIAMVSVLSTTGMSVTCALVADAATTVAALTSSQSYVYYWEAVGKLT